MDPWRLAAYGGCIGCALTFAGAHYGCTEKHEVFNGPV